MKTQQHRTRNLVTDWRDGDAEKLVRFEHASQAGWPGSGGWETTPEEQERGIKEGDCFGFFVTEVDGEMIAVCNIRSKPGQKGNCYIPYLNCRPEFHGKKYGKAVLLAAVECAFERGIDKIDINTWPANEKSVPLYKKMGFMWKPETSVFLENFTPIARRHPWGRRFFVPHDWYSALRRSVDLEPDLLKRGKVKVYEYTWGNPDGGEFLRMVFDPRSWGLIELENQSFCFECSLEDEKLIAGIEHEISYRFRNKTDQVIEVPVSLTSDPGVGIKESPAQLVSIEGGADCVFNGSFVIDPEIEEKKQDPKAAMLRTSLRVAGEDLELAVGFNVKQAIEISLDPSPRSCVLVDQESEAVITLRSNFEENCVVEVDVEALSGGEVFESRKTVEVGPRAGAEIIFPVRAEAPGGFALQVAAMAVRDSGDRPVTSKVKRLVLLARGPLQTIAAAGEDLAMLAGPGSCVYVNLRGGGLRAFRTLRAQRSQRIDLGAGNLGPPYSWDDFFQEKGSAKVESVDGESILVVHSKSLMRPGISLQRRLRLVGDGLIEVADTYTNGSGDRFDLTQSLFIEFRLQGSTDLVVPQTGGVRIQAAGEGGTGADLGRLKLPETDEHWPEGWLCRQGQDGALAAVIWAGMDRLEFNWGWHLKRAVGELALGKAASPSPLYLYVGDGDWRTVQGWWRVLSGNDVPEIDAGEIERPVPVFEAAFEPSPTILRDDGRVARLRLGHVGLLNIDGVVDFKADPGLQVIADESELKIRGLNRDSRVSVPLEVRWQEDNTQPAARITGCFATNEASYRAELDVLRGKPESKCVVESETIDGGEVFHLQTDTLSLRVVPSFQGSAVSLERNGREYLNSPFPKPRPFGWSNPWFGGIMPQCNRFWGSLYLEHFKGSPLERVGRQGITWRGVRVECSLQREKGRGQALYWDYLVTDALEIVAVEMGCRDELGVRGAASLTMNVYPAFSTDEGEGAFRVDGRERVKVFSAPHEVPGGSWRWGGILSGDGYGLYLGTASAFCRCSGQASGRDQGCVLSGELSHPMKANEEVNGLFLLAPVESAEEADALKPISHLTELP